MVEVRVPDLGNTLDEDYMLLNSTAFWVGEEEGDLRVFFHVLNLAREQYAGRNREPGWVIIIEKK